MMNRYFILLLLPIVLFGCSSSPKSKSQQQSFIPIETSESSASNNPQTPELENDVDSNSENNSAPIGTISRGTSYPPQLVNNFMGACIQKGSTQANCGCMLNTLQQNFSEPEYVRLEQQLSATGKLPEFVMQEISNNCHNSGVQTLIARSQQEQTFELEAKYREIERRREQAVRQEQMMLETQLKIQADIPGRMERTSQSSMRGVYDSYRGVSGKDDSLEHPCDYPNQRDSQGNSCGDRSAVVRPGGRF